MRCERCGFESSTPTRYCGGCGALQTSPCPACGVSNPLDFRYCGSCGTVLPISLPAPPVARSATELPAERRQLTVMFCDLVGSTSLSALLDPEELREIVRAYQDAAARVIERYEGYVAQYLGDGVLAYFGYPTALENEASRAVRAARELIAAILELNRRPDHPPEVILSARVGIHSGVVVVGEIGGGRRREHLALGETPNVAARIQAAAEPDQVVLSADTHRLIRGEFACTPLGARPVRGLTEPLELYRVVEEVTGDLALLPAASRAPLVGREGERRHLQERWARTAVGSGGMVRITGESGLGKSALIRAFAAELNADPASGMILTARCLPYFQSSPLHPLADLLRRWILRPALGADPAPRKRLGELLRGHGLPDALPLFASMLGLRNRERESGTPPPPPQWRQRTLEALIELLLQASAERPTLLCVEDLHWADPSTLDLLAALGDRLAGRKLLVLLSHRPEFSPPWPAGPLETELSLQRLASGDVERLIATMAAPGALSAETTTQIVGRADGVPLFVEELTRMVLEAPASNEDGREVDANTGRRPTLAIPMTLHDSLEARLERLSSARELVQLAAVLGREFSFELLRSVSDLEDRCLEADLEELVQAGLLDRSGVGDAALYTFRHALSQEVAYQSMLRTTRQAHHLRVGIVLESRFPDIVALTPEVVAQHHAAGGNLEQAISLWLSAGRSAIERSAHREATVHLRQALQLIDSSPPDARSRFAEAECLVSLGVALMATAGHASDEVRETYARVHGISQEKADPDTCFAILTGLATSCFARLEMEEARRVAEEMLEIARRGGDEGREAAAQIALGTALLGCGRIPEARERLEEGLSGYRRDRDFALAHTTGQDFGVLGGVYSGYAHCALGDPARSAERIDGAVDLARALDHPHSLALALSVACSAAYFRMLPERAVRPLEELEVLAQRQRFPHWERGAAPIRAWLLAMNGDEPGAAALLKRAGLDRPEGDRLDLQSAFWRCIAADVLLRIGREEESERLLSGVISAAAARSSRLWWLPEAYRLRASARVALGRREHGAEDLRLAVDLAGASGAQLFLMRALLDRTRTGDTPDASDLTRLAELRATLPGRDALTEIRAADAILPAPPG